jgi:sialidase-1
MKKGVLGVAIGMLSWASVHGQQVLFAAGDLGYACFRIPAIVQWEPGELYAFAEGRRENCADFGDVDILMRTSVDGGTTWSAPRVIVDNGELQAGNATPILDRMDPAYPEGRLFLFYNTGTASEYDTRMGRGRRRGFYTTSVDHGTTWSDPVEISSQVHMDVHSARPEVDARTWAFAPGHGLQLTHGPHAGRLFVPANHSLGPPQTDFADYQTYGCYSDDHGATWQMSSQLQVPSSNESMAAQSPDGQLLLTVRIQNQGTKRKLIVQSLDGGETWDSTWLASDLPTPMCQSSICYIQGPERGAYYQVGPADTATRSQLTLWSSEHGGLLWQKEAVIYEGPAAYSDIVSLGDIELGVLFERDDYREIVFQRVALP